MKVLVVCLMGLALASVALAGFVHPGVIYQKSQLDFVKNKIKAGAQPWATAFAQLKAHRYSSLSYAPKPRATVNCGAYNQPDEGCSDEKHDFTAALAHALMWVYTGNQAHAIKSRDIMDAWAKVNKAHTNVNAPLQTAWVASIVTRAAEIIRHTSNVWPAASVKRFENFLKTVHYPLIKKGRTVLSGGNWELAMAEAVVNIGVFTNDKKIFDQGVKLFERRLPAYVYMKKDGKLPVTPPGHKLKKAKLIKFWFNQKKFVNGLSQETCRDLDHTEYGLASIVNVAETARIQGVNLYGKHQKRIMAALEFHAKYVRGVAVPSWLCGGKLKKGIPGKSHTYEIGYNHYAGRKKLSMPQTKALLAKIRPTQTNFMMTWETLTHAKAL